MPKNSGLITQFAPLLLNTQIQSWVRNQRSHCSLGTPHLKFTESGFTSREWSAIGIMNRSSKNGESNKSGVTNACIGLWVLSNYFQWFLYELNPLNLTRPLGSFIWLGRHKPSQWGWRSALWYSRVSQWNWTWSIPGGLYSDRSHFIRHEEQGCRKVWHWYPFKRSILD